MKKYMLTFFGGNMALRYDNLNKLKKRNRKNTGQHGGAWIEELAKANHLEVGYPLMSDGKLVDSDGTRD